MWKDAREDEMARKTQEDEKDPLNDRTARGRDSVWIKMTGDKERTSPQFSRLSCSLIIRDFSTATNRKHSRRRHARLMKQTRGLTKEIDLRSF